MDSVKQVERGEDKHGEDHLHHVFEQVDRVDEVASFEDYANLVALPHPGDGLDG